MQTETRAPSVRELERLENCFQREGFVILRSVLSEREARRFRTYLTSSLRRHRALDAPRLGIQTESTACAAIWPDFFQACPQWFGVMCNPALMGALRTLLGKPFVLTRDSVVHWDYFPPWHTDTTTSEAAGKWISRTPQWRMLTAGFYLQSGGSLCVIPGSHSRPDPFIQMRRAGAENARVRDPDAWLPDRAPVELEMQPGDAVVFDMRLVHRASQRPAVDRHGRPCQKIALFSRFSRNIRSHLSDYSEFQFSGAGSIGRNVFRLRRQAGRHGCLVD